MRIAEPGEYAVLGLLVEQPRHGYALAREFAGGTELRQVVRLEMSQLYAILKKMETLGLIAPVSPVADAGGSGSTDADAGAQPGAADHPTGGTRSRRAYVPTAAGRAEFEAWLAQPVARPRDLRLMFLLKLFFALRRTPDDVAALLDQQERTFAAFHHALSCQLAERYPAPPPGDVLPPRFGALVLRARLRQTEAAQRWLSDLRADLDMQP